MLPSEHKFYWIECPRVPNCADLDSIEEDRRKGSVWYSPGWDFWASLSDKARSPSSAVPSRWNWGVSDEYHFIGMKVSIVFKRVRKLVRLQPRKQLELRWQCLTLVWKRYREMMYIVCNSRWCSQQGQKIFGTLGLANMIRRVANIYRYEQTFSTSWKKRPTGESKIPQSIFGVDFRVIR